MLRKILVPQRSEGKHRLSSFRSSLRDATCQQSVENVGPVSYHKVINSLGEPGEVSDWAANLRCQESKILCQIKYS